MRNKYLLSASEIGSVKALLPICEELKKRSESFFITSTGVFTELTDQINSVSFDNENQIKAFLQNQSITRYIFSSNMSDPIPLKIAMVAKSLSIKTIHVLDFWSNYIHRMKLDCNLPFNPDHFIVPDLKAKNDAIKDGIKETTISAYGQPAFGEIKLKSNKEFSQIKGRTIFVMEPIKQDLGMKRGYNEEIVINYIKKALEESKNINLKFDFLVHPRMTSDQITRMLTDFPKANLGNVIHSNSTPLEIVESYPTICGMSSTLLYESWLLGKPIFSIQPNLKMPWLSFYKDLENIIFTDDIVGTKFLKTLEDLSNSFINIEPKYDIVDKHKESVKSILDI